MLRHALSLMKHCLHTAILFTWTDFKTIFFPVAAFACATAPVESILRLLHACSWTWIHLLLCNVSNQARGEAEDAINRPWRPLPSGRITRPRAIMLRWVLVLSCACFSATYGADLISATAILSVTTIFYDELGMAANPIGKNVCCIFGYISFELGATKLASTDKQLDDVALTAIILSGILIFTTIQTQDFADVEGDRALGRVTLPILLPEISRVITSLALVSWSVVLGWYWDVGMSTKAVLLLLGCYVSWRIYSKRSVTDDKHSYIMYNLWLTFAHALPLHKRHGLFYL